MDSEIMISNTFVYSLVKSKLTTESNCQQLHFLELRNYKAERRIRTIKSLYGIKDNLQLIYFSDYSVNNFNIMVTLNNSLVRTNYYYFC